MSTALPLGSALTRPFAGLRTVPGTFLTSTAGRLPMSVHFNVILRCSALTIFFVLLLFATSVAMAEDHTMSTKPDLVIAPDATTTLQFVDVDIKVLEWGVHVSGALRGRRLRQRLFRTASPRVLSIELRRESGEIRASKQIALSVHDLHQHGSQSVRFDAILEQQPEPGDTVVLDIVTRSSADTSPHPGTP